MKKLKTMIVIVSILVILLIIGMVIIIYYPTNEQERSTDNGYQEPKDLETERELKNAFEEVDNKNEYYAIKKIFSSYITYIKQANGIIGNIIYEEQEVREQAIKAIYKMLGPEYIQQFGIDEEELANKIVSYESYDFTIKKIYVSERTNTIDFYLIYAKLYNEDFNLGIKTDSKNMTFCIYPQEYLMQNQYIPQMEEKNIQISNDNVEKNDYNIFNYNNISDQYITIDYMNTYRNIMLNDIELAYNTLVETYREKRFENIQKFQKYVDDNREEIMDITVEKYLKKVYDEYTEYVVMDQYDNIYVFKSYHIMNFEVELDDYTISTEELDNEYMKLSKQEKVANNINKWIKMLNHRDYEAAFSVLDETFRTENFQNSVDEFEKYMRYYFPDHYKIGFEEFSEEAGTYIQEIIMEDITGENTMKTAEHIYMELGEGTDFVMSFNVL